ncbi:peptidylprolyl isomerase [Lysinibacillus sp. 38-6]|uniref:peptidylprolyl isomerase n=1 Tax=Lysinibacillus sp. 38-6 TaxID=3385991 RepID=UPI003908B6F5
MLARSKVLYFVMSLMALVVVLTGCGTSKEDTTAEENVDYATNVKENPIVTITMNNDKKIVIELEPKVAPNTVANFVSLVEKGFYDGLIFHRVIPGFMIQGGDPAGNGSGGPDYSIKGEFTNNDFENNLKHERGVISMARTNDPNSAGSQFFIMVEETSQLDGDYAAFGKVIEGMETVDEIVAVERDATDKPLEDQVMKKVEVDTKGFAYPDPVVQK